MPDGVDASHPAPAVAVWHQHNGEWHLGKVEPAGLAGNPMHHTGVALAKEGYVVLCPDALCFGERQSKHLKGGDFERFEFLRYVVAGKCMAWKNILDMRRAIDYLCSRPEVQPRPHRLLRPLDGLDAHLAGRPVGAATEVPGRQLLPAHLRGHPPHAHPALLPELHPRAGSSTATRRTSPALIAPRALHLNFGENDGGSPIEEVRAGVERLPPPMRNGRGRQVQLLHRAKHRSRPVGRDVAENARLVRAVPASPLTTSPPRHTTLSMSGTTP